MFVSYIRRSLDAEEFAVGYLNLCNGDEGIFWSTVFEVQLPSALSKAKDCLLRSSSSLSARKWIAPNAWALGVCWCNGASVEDGTQENKHDFWHFWNKIWKNLFLRISRLIALVLEVDLYISPREAWKDFGMIRRRPSKVIVHQDFWQTDNNRKKILSLRFYGVSASAMRARIGARNYWAACAPCLLISVSLCVIGGQVSRLEHHVPAHSRNAVDSAEKLLSFRIPEMGA